MITRWVQLLNDDGCVEQYTLIMTPLSPLTPHQNVQSLLIPICHWIVILRVRVAKMSKDTGLTWWEKFTFAGGGASQCHSVLQLDQWKGRNIPKCYGNREMRLSASPASKRKADQRRWSSMVLFAGQAKAGKENWEENLKQRKQYRQITGTKTESHSYRKHCCFALKMSHAGIRNQDPSNCAQGNGELLRNLNCIMSYVHADVCCL